MEEIQEKRRLVLSHKEGLKDDFLKNQSGGYYSSKFKTNNSKHQNEMLYQAETESLNIFLDDLDSMQLKAIEEMNEWKQKLSLARIQFNNSKTLDPRDLSRGKRCMSKQTNDYKTENTLEDQNDFNKNMVN